MHLLGTHGTCRSRASAIIASQTFLPSVKDTRAGPGIYFWAYESNCEVAKELAELWWRLSHFKWKTYKDEADSSCGIVGVKIKSPGDGAYLDTTSTDFRDALVELSKIHKDKVATDGFDLFGYLLENIERSSGTKIEVIKAAVNTPKRIEGFEQTFVQRTYLTSPAYVVRDSGTYLFEEIYEMA